MTAAALVPPASRNAPCPCGSGKRYKHCCGRNVGVASVAEDVPHYLGWDKFRQPERASLWATMQHALAAQKLGQLDDARTLYEEVVARAPLTFDAVHMLGVVRMQQGDLDDAEAMLTRASELAPGFEAIRHNLAMLRDRKREHEGLYSAAAICHVDMLRLRGARGILPSPSPSEGFLPTQAGDVVHVVVPGDVLNGAANRSGLLLHATLQGARRSTLWTDPSWKVPMAALSGARAIDVDSGVAPSRGVLAVFGVNRRTIGWLPTVAESFSALVFAIDAHDPAAYVELIDSFPASALSRLRLVARSAEVLADLGLPGVVDTQLFLPPSPVVGVVPRARSPRIGVFVPAMRDREDGARWKMIEWLRSTGAFLRLLYPGRLPSRHVPDDEEHLISLIDEWDEWSAGLDALFFWGGEGRLRQYDRLVFEALSMGLRIVADGFGDYGPELSRRSHATMFFTAAQARRAIEHLVFGT